jgi:hypothetical protein
MSKKTISVEKEVRSCDYCGAPAEGMYSTCDLCGKDICQKHGSFAGEEDSYCFQCYALGWNEITRRQSEKAALHQAAWKAEKAAHPGHLKIDGIWKDKTQVLVDLSAKLCDAITRKDERKIGYLTDQIKHYANRDY